MAEDRITDILTRQFEKAAEQARPASPLDRVSDIVRALTLANSQQHIRALSGDPVLSYGDELTRIEDRRTGAENRVVDIGTTLLDALRARRQGERADERLGLERAAGERAERRLDLQEQAQPIDLAYKLAQIRGSQGSPVKIAKDVIGDYKTSDFKSPAVKGFFDAWMLDYARRNPDATEVELRSAAARQLKALGDAYREDVPEDGYPKGSPAIEDLQIYRDKLTKQLEEAEDAGDPNRMSELAKQIEEVEGRIKKEVERGGGETVEVDLPGIGRVTITSGAQGKAADADYAKLRDIGDRIAEIESALGQMRRTPTSVGIPGKVIEYGGGLLSQLPGIGEWAADKMDLPEVQSVRTRLNFIVAELLPIITKDQSGRYTDRERAIANEAAKALDPTAGFVQAQAALQTIIDIDKRARARILMRNDGIPDLTSREGRQQYWEMLHSQHPEWTVDQLGAALERKMDEYNFRVF